MNNKMSYVSFDELESQLMVRPVMWVGTPLQEEVVIPDRSVRFKEQINETMLFEKDSPPSACSEFDVKFQAPCDTVSSSSTCLQTNRVFTLVR